MKAKTLAIPLRTVEFSESSQVVSLYTRNYGLLEGIAKGAHREKGSFQGPFDLTVLYEVVFLLRRSAGLSILTESTVVEGFGGIRRRWVRHVAACHVLEFLRAVATASDPETALFDLTAETLAEVSAGEEPRVIAALARFDALALRILGLLAPIRACVRCGRGWPGGERPVFISTHAGGLLCSSCRARSTDLAEQVAGGVVRVLSGLSDFETPIPDCEPAWREHGPRARRVLSGIRDHLLEREFVSLKMCRV